MQVHEILVIAAADALLADVDLEPEALGAAVRRATLSGRFRPSTFLEHVMAKPTTAKIRLNSEGGSGFFYVTKKNTRTMTEKFSIKKYDPVLRKHVEFKEGKIK